jgi:predicted O-methyltransferase YrrM
MKMPMFKDEVREALIKYEPDKVRTVVEIGTGWGESMIFFSSRYPKSTVFTVDSFGLYGDGRIYSQWQHEAMKVINEKVQSCRNVVQILGDSSRVPFFTQIDVLFIDGNHTYDGCKADFDNYGKWVRKGGIICFDDYTQENNPLNGVKKAVEFAMFTNQYEIIYAGHYCAILKKL